MPRFLAALLASLLTASLLVAAPAEARPAGKSAKAIVAVAKRHVGGKYRDGGASPKRGFDCSGFTKYVYGKAKVAKLPHNAEAQRRMKRMHRVSRAKARPGDLVFYGKPAFHVAIYAGKGKQYSAATRRDGVRYQKIWSRTVTFARYR